MMVVRHRRIVAEGWWSPYDAKTPRLLYSLSKSFTSVAAGLAVEDGLVKVDDALLAHLGSFAPVGVDDRSRRITLDDALRMATGHVADLAEPVMAWCDRNRDPEWLHALFAMPPEREPGTVFAYNQLATYAVSRIVQQVTGQGLLDYLGARLLSPLGISDCHWLRDAGGRELGFSGLYLTTESVAAFGQLCLQRGVWHGWQLVPAHWFDTATAARMPNDRAHLGEGAAVPEPDWAAGYGYQFWQSQHGYRGDGAYGQFCIVLPEQAAVVVLTSSTERMQLLLDLVWEYVVPAMGTAKIDEPVADDELAARLISLAIPAPDSDGDGHPASFTRGHGDAAATLTAVRLTRAADGHELALTIDGSEHILGVVEGAWQAWRWPGDRVIPFMVAGGWAGGSFVADLRMVHTPHLLRLAQDPASGTFDCDWREPPLHGPDPVTYGV